ncbi:MAG TPA: hypothetical protein PKD61_20545 [Polyangiaceae bacterium]|nr:hypothetical protein [Polyangiaceae bacterium]
MRPHFPLVTLGLLTACSAPEFEAQPGADSGSGAAGKAGADAQADVAAGGNDAGDATAPTGPWAKQWYTRLGWPDTHTLGGVAREGNRALVFGRSFVEAPPGACTMPQKPDVLWLEEFESENGNSVAAADEFVSNERAFATAVAYGGGGRRFVGGGVVGMLQFPDASVVGEAEPCVEGVGRGSAFFARKQGNAWTKKSAIGANQQIVFDVDAAAGSGMLATGTTHAITTVAGKSIDGPEFPDCFLSSSDTATSNFVAVLGGTSAQYCQALATDGSRIAVAGSNAGIMTGAGAPLPTAGGDDAFVAVFDVLGVPIWREGFGSTGKESALDVALSKDMVIAVGNFSGSFTHAGPLISKGDQDAFVVAFDLAGKKLWEFSLGTEGSDRAEDVAIASDGRVFVAGYLNNSSSATVPLQVGNVSKSVQERDAFILELSEKGAFISFVQLGGKGHQAVAGIVLSGDTATDDVIVAGTFSSELRVEGNVLDTENVVTSPFGGLGYLMRLRP